MRTALSHMRAEKAGAEMENNIVDLSEYVDAVLADESNILIVPDDRRDAVIEIVAEERKLQMADLMLSPTITPVIVRDN